MTTLAILFVYSGQGQAVARELAIGAFWFAIPTLLFLVALYVLLGRYPLIQSFAGAFLVWLVAAAAMNRVIVPG
ncbi:MAG: GlpM family protein [Methanoregula sp.]